MAVDLRRGLPLALGATLATLLALELGLRLLDRWTAFDFFHVLRSERNTRPDTELRLIDLIVLSPDDDLIFELAPRLRGRFLGAPLRTDERGVRVPAEPRPPAAPGALRVVALGDSHTFGWGVSYEDTFAARLARRFETDHPGGPAVEVVNLGVPGYNTHQEVESLAAKGLTPRPDLVVMLADRNDLGLAAFIQTPRDTFGLERSFLLDLVQIRLKLLLRGDRFRNVRPPRGLAKTQHELGERLLYDVTAADLARIPPRYRAMAGRRAVDRALDRLAGMTRARGVPVIFAFYEEGLDEPLRDALLRAAAERGLDTVDLATPVARALGASGRPIESLFVSAGDPHPAPGYHALIADAIYAQRARALLEAAAVARPAGR
jgi:lysophospholipase L1-like esterase